MFYKAYSFLFIVTFIEEEEEEEEEAFENKGKFRCNKICNSVLHVVTGLAVSN
jgi:hypothetical protein